MLSLDKLLISDFYGIIDNHYPKNKLLQFLQKTNWILPKKLRQEPIPQGITVFTDGSNNGKAVIISEKGHQLIQTNCTSAQRAELVAALTALQIFLVL